MEQAEISQLMAGVSPELAQKLQADDSIGSVLRKVKDYDSDKVLVVLNILIELSESEREEIRRVMQGMEEEERGMPEVLEMTEAGKAEELTESERGILTGADDEGQWMVVDMKSNEIDVAASIVNMNNVLKGKLPVKAASGKRLVKWQEYVDDKKKIQSQAKEKKGKRSGGKEALGRKKSESVVVGRGEWLPETMKTPVYIIANSADKKLINELLIHLSTLRRVENRNTHAFIINDRGGIQEIVQSSSQPEIIYDIDETTFLDIIQQKGAAIIVALSANAISTLPAALDTMMVDPDYRLCPLLLRPCNLDGVALVKNQFLNVDEKAITSCGNRDEAWQGSVEQLRKVMASIDKERKDH